MEKEFCTYEIALTLKELGFDEPCIAFYAKYDFNNDPGEEIKKGSLIPFEQGSKYCGKSFYLNGFNVYPQKDSNIALGYVILAPLWQQAIDWFREKHNIYIDLVGTYSYQQGVGRWFKMYEGIVNHMPSDSNDWECVSCGDDESSLYNAREAAILKAIEYVRKESKFK